MTWGLLFQVSMKIVFLETNKMYISIIKQNETKVGIRKEN
jgi:hypothetical protein